MSRVEELQQRIEEIDSRIELARKAGSNQLVRRLLCRRSGFEAEKAVAEGKKYAPYVLKKIKPEPSRRRVTMAGVAVAACIYAFMIWLWQKAILSQ